ncbi:MAG: DegT/DnrJ/EryC1/StrS family aminotransferase [Pseudomonadota bacterium]
MTKLWPIYSEECIADCTKLIRSGRTYYSTEDEEVALFEKLFLETLTNHRFSIFANSATSIAYAIYLYLRNNRPISDAPNMVVPAHTYRASVLPLLPLGIRPYFYDQKQIGKINAQVIEQLVDENTIGILVTHLFGVALDLTQIYGISRDLDIPLIEDCSHAHGVSVGDWKPGDGAFAAFFSTGTKKIISGGMGGMLCTSSVDLYHQALATTQPPLWARKKALNSDIFYYGSGFNMRGTPISARLARDHLERIEEIILIKNKCLSIVKKAVRNNTNLELIESSTEQQGTYYNLPFYIKSDIENTLKKYRINNLRCKRYQEYLPAHPIFRDELLCTDGYNHEGLCYFDTRDMYESTNAAEAYAEALDSKT